MEESSKISLVSDHSGHLKHNGHLKVCFILLSECLRSVIDYSYSFVLHCTLACNDSRFCNLLSEELKREGKWFIELMLLLSFSDTIFAQQKLMTPKQ